MKQFYNMDCIKGAKRHIPDESVDLIITDPPFGISGDRFDQHYNRQEENVIQGYIEVPKEKYAQFTAKWIEQAFRILKPNGSIYIVSGFSNSIDIENAINQVGLEILNMIIWKYNFGVHTKNKFITSHYSIFFCKKKGGEITFNSGTDLSDMTDFWEINKENKRGQMKNQNQLPIKLVEKMIRYSSNKNDLVCDFFLGGFTTAKVALDLNRRIIGFEKNKNAYDYFTKQLFGTKVIYSERLFDLPYSITRIWKYDDNK